MAAQAQKPRKRIVPQLITNPGSQDRDEEAALLAGQPEAAPQPAVDQREQSEWAREHLGPDRKVFLDLSALQNTEIDWKQICKERGVQKSKKAATVENDGDKSDPLLLRGRTGRQEDNWSRLLAKLEATYCLGAVSEDEEEGGDRDEEGSESGASDDEADEEGGKSGGASDGGEGGKEGGEGGKEGEGKKKGPKNDYDYMDEFIDDEEFIQLVAHDKRKPKHTGFFISKGEIERTEEMLPGFEDLEKEKKRGGGGGKRKAEAGDDGAAPAAKEAKPGGAAGGEKKKRKQAEAAEEGGEGAGGEGQPPKKKKKKAAAEAGGAAAAEAGMAVPAMPLSIAEQARLAGQLMAGGVAAPAAAAAAAAPIGSTQAAPSPSAKKKAPYEMPPEVAAAIQTIREVASQQPAPAPAPAAAGAAEGEEGGKKTRRVLPKPIKDALFRFSAAFLAEVEKHGAPASNRMMDELLGFLEPFASRASILNYLRNANKEKKPKEAPKEAPKGMSEDDIKALIAEKVKPLPEGSDDDFEAPAAPRGSDPPSGTQGTGGTQGAALQAAAPERKGPNKYVKALDRKVQEQVYLYMNSRLGEEKLHSVRGKLLQTEVYNWFPPNSIDPAAIVSIYNSFKNRERRQAEKAAQQAAAASAGTAAAPAASGPLAAQQQAQHRQLQATMSGEVVTAEAFAAMAVASAQKALGQSDAQPAAQQALSAQLSAAQVAAALQAAAPAVSPPPAAAQRPRDFLAAAAAEAEEALAAAAAATPQRQQAQQQQHLQPVAEQQTAPQQAQQAQQQPSQPPRQVPAQREQQQPQGQPQGQQQGQQGPAVLMSDDDVVAAGVQHGAAEAELRQLLAASQEARPALYSCVLTKTMMVAGPKGVTTAEAANKAVELGFATWDPTNSYVKNSLAKSSHHPWVAYLGASRYTLKCFPGIRVVERPVRGPKKPGPAAPGGSSAAGGSSPVPAAGGPADEAAAADASRA
ncbi:hypothetical protein ABPG75_011532 [Micractinium tetrahymenae]